MSHTWCRKFRYPQWTDSDQNPRTRAATLERRAGPRPPAGAKCDTCQRRARNCVCPDGPDLE